MKHEKQHPNQSPSLETPVTVLLRSERPYALILRIVHIATKPLGCTHHWSQTQVNKESYIGKGIWHISNMHKTIMRLAMIIPLWRNLMRAALKERNDGCQSLQKIVKPTTQLQNEIQNNNETNNNQMRYKKPHT